VLVETPQAVNSGNSDTTGANLHAGISPTSGRPIIMTYANNQWYNLPEQFWIGPGGYGSFAGFYIASPSANVIDAGGNVALTTYEPQTVIDPLTGEAPIDKPLVYLGHYNSPDFCRPALVDADCVWRSALRSQPCCRIGPLQSSPVRSSPSRTFSMRTERAWAPN
jgi:hypothetical protein